MTEETKVQCNEQVCWHCGVVLAYVSKPRCEDCPDECDEEKCDEMSCTDQPQRPETKTRADVFTIKPLEWCEVNPDHWIAESFERTVYEVSKSVSRIEMPGSVLSMSCASPEEGKALAEAHWQEHIKQGLEKA